MRSSHRKTWGMILVLLVFVFSALGVTPAYAAWIFSNKTTVKGLGNDSVNGVFVSGNTVWAGTDGGLSISTDGGNSFINKTTNDGLGNNTVFDVYVSGGVIYAGTAHGVSISTDGGSTFINKTTADGLGSNGVPGIFARDGVIYAATTGGLSISTDGGSTFNNKTTANGLGGNWVYDVVTNGSVVYAATWGGLSISTNGGLTFINKTTANGLGDNLVRGVFFSGSTLYAATNAGLSLSTDWGGSFTNKTKVNGLGNNIVYGVYANGSMVYAATWGGLSISEDGGSSYINKTTADGLGNDVVYDVFTVGSSVYAATWGGLSIGKNVITYRSIDVYDGWVLESTETSAAGGSVNSTLTNFRLGDDAANRQYRAVLHFNTSYLPDTAVITKATLKIYREGLVGVDPFSILGGLRVDIQKPFFGITIGLLPADFQAVAGKSTVAIFNVTPVSGWYTATLNDTGRAFINRVGTTQFRLRFALDDNNNSSADYMAFFSGDYIASQRPTLVVEYYIP